MLFRSRVTEELGRAALAVTLDEILEYDREARELASNAVNAQMQYC